MQQGKSGDPLTTQEATEAKRAELRWADPWRRQTTAWPSSVDREGHPWNCGSFSLELPGPPPCLAAQRQRLTHTGSWRERTFSIFISQNRHPSHISSAQTLP